MNSYSVEAVLQATGVSQFVKSFEDAKSSVDKVKQAADKMEQTGKTLTKKVTLPLAAMGAGVLKVGSDYESSMSKVQAISGASADEMEQLGDAARGMAKETRYSAGEAADALSYMSLAGWDVTESIDALPAVLDLATASGMDLSAASDTLTDTMSMFGIESEEASRAADVFAAAQANSNLSVDQLSEALIKAGPTAAALGEDIEETSAMLGIFADQGLKGSKAGTTLDAMYRDVQQAAEDGAIAIGDSSVAVYDAEGNFRGMSAIMEEVEAATHGMTDEQRRSALAGVFQQQSMGGVNMLLAEGSDGLADLTGKLYDSEGAAKDMANTMDDNMQGAFMGLRSSIEEVAIQFFELGNGPIRSLIDWITNLVDRFGALDSGTQQWIMLAALAAAAIGPLLIVGAKLVKGILAIAKVVGTLMKVKAALTLALGVSSVAFFGIIAAIAAAIAIGVMLYKNWDTVVAKARELHERVKAAVQAMVQAVVTFFRNLHEQVQATVQNMVAAVVNFFRNLHTRIQSTVQNMVAAVVNFFRNLHTSIQSTVQNMVMAVINFFRNMFSQASNIANNIRNAVTNTFNALRTAVTTAFSRVATAVRNGMTRAFRTVTGFFSRFKNAGANIIGNIADGIRGAIGKVTDAVGNVMQKARDLLPFSPPKDKSSPLHGIEKNGITEQIAKGIYNGEGDIDKAMNSVLGGNAFDVNAHATHSTNSNVTLSGNNRIEHLLEQLLNKNTDILLDGDTLVGSTINRVDTTLNRRRMMEERWSLS